MSFNQWSLSQTSEADHCPPSARTTEDICTGISLCSGPEKLKPTTNDETWCHQLQDAAALCAWIMQHVDPSIEADHEELVRSTFILVVHTCHRNYSHSLSLVWWHFQREEDTSMSEFFIPTQEREGLNKFIITCKMRRESLLFTSSQCLECICLAAIFTADSG